VNSFLKGCHCHLHQTTVKEFISSQDRKSGHRGKTTTYFVVISKQLRIVYECIKILTCTQNPFQGHQGSCSLTVGDPYYRSFQFPQLNIFHITLLSISVILVVHHFMFLSFIQWGNYNTVSVETTSQWVVPICIC
jgi:hypothetical protein